jgi:hypothetical protein
MHESYYDKRRSFENKNNSTIMNNNLEIFPMILFKQIFSQLILKNTLR